MRTHAQKTELKSESGQLELLGKPRDSECAWIEISANTARAYQQARWRSGEHMLITLRFPSFAPTRKRCLL